MKVINKPNSENIDEISKWLNEQKQSKINNYYDNFININYELNENNFICISDDLNRTVGFIYFWISDKTAEIVLSVVKDSEINKGYGSILLENLILKLKELGIVSLSLVCSPSSSKRIWKKMGFKEFKEIENHRFLKSSNKEQPWLYMILVETQKTTTKQSLKSYIELWTLEEHHHTNETNSTYRWDISNRLKPIVYPVDGDWNIKHIEDGKLVYNGKIKYYNKGSNIDGNFLII